MPIRASVPPDESERLRALDAYQILDTGPEPAFDDLARLASLVCGTPIALVSLIDARRQWLKAHVGLDVAETAREVAFCAHVVAGGGFLEVPDARRDPRFTDNPLVTGDPAICFYAGAPLVTADGHVLGTLCVIDRQPRALTPAQRAALSALARQVMTQLELRLQNRRLEELIASSRETERALRVERAYLEQLFESAPEAIVVLDPAERVVRANGEFTRMFQFEREEYVGHSINDLIVPAHLRDEGAALTDVVTRGGRVAVETVRWRKDRTAVHVSILGTPVRLDGGQVGVYAIYRDITARHRAEEDRDRFFSISVDLLCVADFEGRFRKVNPAWERTLGHALDELLEQPLVSFVHPEDREATLRALRQLADGEPSLTFENRCRCRDGSYRWLLWSATPYRHQGLIYATAHDITGRKRVEEALTASEAFSRGVTDHMLEGLVIVDETGTIVSVNRAGERIFGYKREELVGRHLGILLPDAARSRADDFLREARQRAIGRISEWQARRKDGAVFPFELSLFDFEAGGRLFLAGAIRDVSERREVERLKKEFVATVSHELRTPLTSIRGALGLLAAGGLGSLPDRARELVAVAERNSARLVTLINDILDLERLESGRTQLRRADIPAGTIIHRAIETVAPAVAAADIRIVAPETSARIWADADRLTQVLVNLLSNAIKFSPAGSEVRVTVDENPHWVEVRVSDQGRGIPPALQEAVFERFRQVAASDERDKGGTGLGLSICKAIIEQHRGLIGVESDEGAGATFWFRVPPSPQTSALASHEATAQ